MRIHVEGGQPLNGDYHPAGNPNAAMALTAAALLTDKPVALRNVPVAATSTTAAIELAERLGAVITSGGDGALSIRAAHLSRSVLTAADTATSVGSILFLAPLLARRQHVRVEFGFPLNRIRTHLEALRDLGQDVATVNSAIECRAVAWDYQDIILAQASVTATALVMMLAAALGKETIVHNAACEPHIRELALFLESMGAHIEGIGSNMLRILSPPELTGAEAEIGCNHIEAASVAALAALTGGDVQIKGIRASDMRMIKRVYQRFGIQLGMDETTIFLLEPPQLVASNREEDTDASIETAIWPGFPSDLVAMATVIATQTRGTSLIHEKLFNNRLLFVDRLKAMGAQIVLCDPHRAIVVGPTPLYAIYMDSPDVRAGLGMLAAALVASGTSVIDNAQALEHTFGGVIPRLQELGARIEEA
ncbi:MAG: UDP-N-acetylglucosamine 1-carboxyvinyltransferase [Aggregatilineales bacterium]